MSVRVPALSFATPSDRRSFILGLPQPQRPIPDMDELQLVPTSTLRMGRARPDETVLRGGWLEESAPASWGKDCVGISPLEAT